MCRKNDIRVKGYFYRKIIGEGGVKVVYPVIRVNHMT